MGRSEEIVGKAIAGRRDEVVLATKCGLVWHTDRGNHFFDQAGQPVHRHLGRDSIFHEVEQSLRRLGTDRIDLYITHWQDPTTPVAETMGALEDLKRAGKIRAIGASNLSPADLEAYLAAGHLDAIQEQFSMVHRDVEATLAPLCIRHGVSILSYSSLALGLLTGRIGPERVFEGDDQRNADPRFSPGEPPAGRRLRRGDPPGRRGARRHGRRAGDRLDAAPAGDHLRALRRAQPRSGAGERARRNPFAEHDRPRPHRRRGSGPPRGRARLRR